VHLPSQVKHLDKYRLSDDQGCSRLVSLRERERGATRKGESAVLSGTFSIAAVTTPRHRRGETGHPTKKQPTLATDTYPRRASIVRLQSGTLPLPTYLTLPYLCLPTLPYLTCLVPAASSAATAATSSSKQPDFPGTISCLLPLLSAICNDARRGARPLSYPAASNLP